jgi:hypothetical protein
VSRGEGAVAACALGRNRPLRTMPAVAAVATAAVVRIRMKDSLDLTQGERRTARKS